MASSNSVLLPDVELKGKITEKDDIILGCKFEGNIAANKINLSIQQISTVTSMLMK